MSAEQTTGTIDNEDGRVTFRYRRELRQPIDRVWAAITEPAEIAAWMGTKPEIELRPGGRYITRHGEQDERVIDRVLRVRPVELFEHTYFEQVNPGAVVTWRLRPTDNGTTLDLTHVLAYDDLRAAMATVRPGADLITILARNGAGWHRLLDLLRAHLTAAPSRWTDEDQRHLRQQYEQCARSAAESWPGADR